jgi:hypothetical protein
MVCPKMFDSVMLLGMVSSRSRKPFKKDMFGVQSLEIGADLLLKFQCRFTATRIFSGNEFSCFFNG